MENLEAIVQLIDSWLWGRWLVFVLLALGVLYTVSNGFIQVRHFGFIKIKGMDLFPLSKR